MQSEKKKTASDYRIMAAGIAAAVMDPMLDTAHAALNDERRRREEAIWLNNRHGERMKAEAEAKRARKNAKRLFPGPAKGRDEKL